MTDELTPLPCPFCGSDDVDPAGYPAPDRTFGPRCRACGAASPSVFRWNARATRPIDLVRLGLRRARGRLETILADARGAIARGVEPPPPSPRVQWFTSKSLDHVNELRAAWLRVVTATRLGSPPPLSSVDKRSGMTAIWVDERPMAIAVVTVGDGDNCALVTVELPNDSTPDGFGPVDPPSYHDLFVETPTIPRTSIFNLPLNLEVSCMRTSGWQLWRRERTGHRTQLAGELHDVGLRLDVAGRVIVDSITRRSTNPDDGAAENDR